MSELFLSHNSLNSFEGSPRMLLNSSLDALDLRSNAFQGSFPVISPRLSYVLASDNSFTGEIPLSLCNQTYLNLLDLAHNNFSCSIPRCLIISVQDVDLGNNNLIGRLPDLFYKLGLTRTLDVSNNQITGKLSCKLHKPRVSKRGGQQNRRHLSVLAGRTTETKNNRPTI